jgi:ribose transport system permease protein
MLNLKKDLGLFVLILVIGTVVALINPRFLSAINISNTANLVGLFGMFSIGQAFVIITGGIELSVGSMIALLGVIFVDLIASRGVPWPIAALIILALGVLMGLAHGLLITKKRMQPFVVTLCGLLIYRGIARFYTADATAGFPFGVRFEYLEYLTTGRTDIVALLTGDTYTSIPMPHSFLFMLIVAAIMWVVLHRTVFGRHLYAVGKNEEAARFSGIRTDRVILAAYAICGVLTAVSSIFLAMYTRSILPSSHGNFYELYAIAAAVLGGFSLRGGEGSIVGVVLGAILLQVLQNLVNLLGIPSSLNFAVSGSVILIGVLADQEYANFRERRERLRRLAGATSTGHIDDPPTGDGMPAAGARPIDRDSQGNISRHL